MGAWTIYTRERPDLRDAPATLVCEVESYRYAPPQATYVTDEDENHLWFDPPFDPLAGSPWLLEITHRIVCTALEEDRDDAWIFIVELARRSFGAIHDPTDNTFTWYGWDTAAMLAQVQQHIDAHQLGELIAVLGRARNARSIAPGPFPPLAEHTIAYLDDLPESNAKNSLLVLLATAPELPGDVRHLLEDAILAAPPRGKQGKPLRELQAKLHFTRDRSWATAQATPTTAEAIAALWDRAIDSVRESYVLERALTAEVIIAKAREGAQVPSWPWWGEKVGAIDFTTTHEFAPRHREFFELCGPLAAWLVARWDATNLEPED